MFRTPLLELTLLDTPQLAVRMASSVGIPPYDPHAGVYFDHTRAGSFSIGLAPLPYGATVDELGGPVECAHHSSAVLSVRMALDVQLMVSTPASPQTLHIMDLPRPLRPGSVEHARRATGEHQAQGRGRPRWL